MVLVFYVFSLRPLPEKINYGVSFSKFHSDELQLNWQETLRALLTDLRIKKLRFSAHWPMIQPRSEDEFNFSELDWQMEEARRYDAEVILAVGRRLPGWPECHEPGWLSHSGSTSNFQPLTPNFKQEKLLNYIKTVVNRYQNYPNLKYWQVENEPFLSFFSRATCGPLDKNFLDKEITLVRQLDPAHPILITDSGEFGNWFQAYRRGDIFGSSLYLYIWNRVIGPFRYPLTPAFFRIKRSLTELWWGVKPAILIELSAEPWLLQPITDTSLKVLRERMGVDKFKEIINFARQSSFEEQYLWGAEWWYWMKKQGYPQHWEEARQLF